MANSPSPVVAASHSIRLFSRQKKKNAPESLYPLLDLPGLISQIDVIPTPEHTGVRSSEGEYYSAWALTPSAMEKHAKILYLSRALPSNWNPRSSHAGQGFDAECAREAMTLELRVTLTSIEPLYLYPSKVQLKDYAGEQKKASNGEKLPHKTLRLNTTNFHSSKSIKENEPRRYFASPDTHELIEGTFGCSTRTATSFFGHWANLVVSDLLTSQGIDLPLNKNTEPVAPWYNLRHGQEHSSILALQQIASFVSDAPRLSANTLKRYMESEK